jgi:hypothetical protein
MPVARDSMPLVPESLGGDVRELIRNLDGEHPH